MKKFLLGNSEKILQESYLWNMIGGLLNAGQSALLLVVISRTNPVEDAGVFSIAYAIACLALTVGKWGMRDFQVTDLQEKYDYGTYILSRIITCSLMLAFICYYILKGIWISDYSPEKCMAILFMGLLKMVDAVEDIVHGMFQRKGRLDIGARSIASRYIVVLFTCGLFLFFTHDLVVSLGISVIVSLLYFLLAVNLVYDNVGEKIELFIAPGQVHFLLLDCVALFAGSFLMIYIANAPKYAIDQYMDDATQACFNYIFMPVYVINVMNTFIYQPVLTKLADFFRKTDYKKFIKLFYQQLFMIAILSFCVICGGFFLGIPALSLLYNIDLSGYKFPFMLLLAGSSFLAVSGYLSVVITILRKQNWLLIGYITSAVIAFFTSKPMIIFKGTTGAACLYTGIVFLQAVIFSIIFFKFYRQECCLFRRDIQ